MSWHDLVTFLVGALAGGVIVAASMVIELRTNRPDKH